MSIGTRIMEIRKKNNLSQEAFGETLGVSRQAISKWEMGASIPDVEKLVLMSQIYGVSVGWILGTEETSSTQVDSLINGDARTDDNTSKATVLALDSNVKKILFVFAICIVCLASALGVAFVEVASELKEVKGQYQSLQYQMDHRFDSMMNQMKQQLKKQDELLHEFSVTQEYDLAKNTVTFELYAVPKVYKESMSFHFYLLVDEEEIVVEPTDDGMSYSASVTIELTDDPIHIVAKIDTGEEIQQQILYQVEGLLSETLPYWSGDGNALRWGRMEDGIYTYIGLRVQQEDWNYGNQAHMEAFDLLLYHNGVEILRCEAVKQYQDVFGRESEEAIFLAQTDIRVPLEEGDVLVMVGRVRDEYGRMQQHLMGSITLKDGNIEETEVDWESWGN